MIIMENEACPCMKLNDQQLWALRVHDHNKDGRFTFVNCYGCIVINYNEMHGRD